MLAERPASKAVLVTILVAKLNLNAGELFAKALQRQFASITSMRRLEFAAIDSDQVFAKQRQLLAEQNELTADATN